MTHDIYVHNTGPAVGMSKASTCLGWHSSHRQHFSYQFFHISPSKKGGKKYKTQKFTVTPICANIPSRTTACLGKLLFWVFHFLKFWQ